MKELYKHKKDLFILTIVAVIFTLPIFIFRITNDDLLTHISRLYNLGEEFKFGNFDPSMYIFCYGNYGYPFGIFYPDTFLKPFSLLYSLGIDEYTSMGIMLFTINMSTLLIPYILLKKENIKNSLIISIIYFIYPYRIFDYIKRFALGELMFFVFLPFIVYGVYKIFKEKKMNLYLFVGMYGIIHSHILSIFLILIGLVSYYIYNYHAIDKKVLKYTAMNAIFTILTSFDVTLPILEMQLTESMRYNNNFAFMGTLAKNSFHLFSLDNIFFKICFTLLFVILLVVVRKKSSILKQITLLSFILFLTTNLFCWELLIKIFPVFNIIQFPYRLLVLGIIPWTIILVNISQKTKNNIISMVFILCEVLLIVFLFGFTYQSYDKTKMNDVGAGDYINSEIKIDNKLKEIKIDAEPTNKHIVNNNLPGMFYYKNYSLKDNAGKEYNYKNQNGYIYIDDIPNNTEITVKYKDTVLQKLGYYMSWLGLISVFLYIRRKRCKDLEY